MKVCIVPRFTGVDTGNGGIRRVCEAQEKFLPEYGIDIITSEKDADILSLHAG